MREDASNEEFLYQYELLRTRLEIREYFLNAVVKEVYENIGQVLSYVRMQLALAKTDSPTAWNEKIEPGYQLIGKTIGDLRNMCKLFNPEEAIIKKHGFFEVIRQEVTSQYPLAVYQANIMKENLPNTQDEKMLVVLGMILELLVLLKEEKRPLQLFSITASANVLQFIMQYAGTEVRNGDNKPSPGKYALTVFERASLLGGVLQSEAVPPDTNQLTLSIPLK
ncbi:MAG TPA: hypothetical protein VIM79_17735 [Niastella sp.]